jgi:hypothetical protein
MQYNLPPWVGIIIEIKKLVGLVMGRQMVHCHSPTYVESCPLKIQPHLIYKLVNYPNYIIMVNN